jgi:hypothetical protein
MSHINSNLREIYMIGSQTCEQIVNPQTCRELSFYPILLAACRREWSSSQCQLSLPFSPWSGEFVVKRFGFCQGFLELNIGSSSCTEKRVDPLKEIVRSDAERVEICLKLFLAEIVGFVDSIKDLDKAVNSSCQTTSHQVNFST